MRYIKELHEGEMISETYLCKTKQTLKTKAGKNYYSLLLQDKTGTIDAKVWELSNGIENFESMEYIHIDAQVTSFQSSLQLNVKRIRKSQEGEFDPSDFVPVTDRNVEEMYAELIKLVQSVTEPHLNKLLSSFFVEDIEFMNRFKNHSAAKTVHHGFIGGLLEHTLGVANLCSYMASCYKILDRDLLLTAALFHDIGKLDEISPFPDNDYTDEGQLLGHIYIGAEKIKDRMKTIPGFPPRLSIQLQHCILAHHGELEYGSPKKPALAEAVALTYADNVDAKLETMTEILKAADEKAEWVGYNRFFESNIRRTVY